MNHVDKQKGFTLIELMLAMGFVSALLIAVAMTVIQIANIYNRGITLKDVNQAGRSIASELQRSIAGSASFNIDSGVGSRYIQQSLNGKNAGGRLCIGQYSYIWNYGSAIKPNDTSSSPNLYLDPDLGRQIRFVKVIDPNANYCIKDINGKYPSIKLSDSVELLDDVQDRHDLAIHSFSISSTPSASDTAYDAKTGQRLYSIEFLIGTNDQTALMHDSGLVVTGCLPPSDPNSDPSYCSVNQFNIVARAGNTIK